MLWGVWVKYMQGEHGHHQENSCCFPQSHVLPCSNAPRPIGIGHPPSRSGCVALGVLCPLPCLFPGLGSSSLLSSLSRKPTWQWQG